MTKVILFLRSLLFYLGYLIVTLFLSILCLVVVWFIPESKQHALYTVWCRIILAWFRISCGVNYEVVGLENIPDVPVVAVANHQSEWETVFLYRYLAPVCLILKKELLSIPFYGWGLRLLKPIAIDRSKRHVSGKSILTQGQARLQGGRSVIIFPEGTRGAAGELKRLSRGGAKLAVAAQVPLLPIAHDAGHCWPARRFLKYPGTISVNVGKPVATQNLDASDLTSQLEEWMRHYVVKNTS